MDEEKLVNLWNEYLEKKDTYTPEQQEAMESKFGTLVQKAMAEKEQTETKTKVEVKPRYTQPKQEPKQYRVTL